MKTYLIGQHTPYFKRQKAVTSVTYGLIACFIVLLIAVSVSTVGGNLKSLFGWVGNGLEAGNVYGMSTAGLAQFQQNEIDNAQTEIANGTASLACLQTLSQNPQKMSANNATCLGPGYGITPPSSPVMEVGFSGDEGVMLQITESGAVYSYSGWDADGTGGAEGGVEGSAQYFMGDSAIAFYENGYIDGDYFNWNYGENGNGGDANCDGGHAAGNYSGDILTPQANTYGGVACTSPNAQFIAPQNGVINIGPGNMGYYVGNGSTVVTW